MHVLGLFEIKVFIFHIICVKAKDEKSLNFYTKTKLTPLEKCEFLAFF